VLRHHVLERGERVIVAGTSVPNLELHHRMLMAAIESDPRVLDGSLRKPVVVLVHADSDRLMLKQISKDPLRYCREHQITRSQKSKSKTLSFLIHCCFSLAFESLTFAAH
jgi:hypothetical protein